VVTAGVLQLGHPLPGSLPASGARRYYRLDLASDASLRFVLDDANNIGSNELYVRFGAPPTRSTYDFRYSTSLAADQLVRVPEAQPGAYYVLLFGESVPDAPAAFTITAIDTLFSIHSISANRGGNAGRVTTRIRGARFDSGTQAVLVSSSNQRINAQSASLSDSTDMWATFDLQGVQAGLYDVELVAVDQSTVTLNDAFTVIQGGGDQL
jgi:hypothetical protein